MASNNNLNPNLREIVSSLSGVDYGELEEPPPVACAAGGVALACALRPPGAGEVIPQEAGVILLKLDGCGTSVCLQGDPKSSGADLRGATDFRLALHRCLQGDQHSNIAIPAEGLGYFSSSSAGAGEPRLQPAGGVVFTCNGRGARFHKEPNAEGRGLEAALPGVPFIGMFAGGEFGPGPDHWAGSGDEPCGSHGLPMVFPRTFCSVVAMFG
jgi:hypothetical protein